MVRSIHPVRADLAWERPRAGRSSANWERLVFRHSCGFSGFPSRDREGAVSLHPLPYGRGSDQGDGPTRNSNCDGSLVELGQLDLSDVIDEGHVGEGIGLCCSDSNITIILQ